MFPLYLCKLLFSCVPRLSPCYPEAVLCPSMTSVPLSLFPSPSPLSFTSCLCLLFLSRCPSGANKSLCWELDLGGSRYFSFQMPLPRSSLAVPFDPARDNDLSKNTLQASNRGRSKTLHAFKEHASTLYLLVSGLGLTSRPFHHTPHSSDSVFFPPLWDANQSGCSSTGLPWDIISDQ